MAAIRLVAGGFTVRQGWFSKTSCHWHDVRCIEAVKLDRVTYEEDGLVLTMDDGKQLLLGEFDKGFAAFEAEIYRECPGCNEAWRPVVADGPVGVPFEIWSA